MLNATAIINSVYPQPSEDTPPDTSKNSKSRALNLVTKIHASRVVNGKLVSICDCISNFRVGLVQIGPRCAQYRIEFLNRDKMRPGHTHKTGGANGKRREERKYYRSKMAFPESDSTRNDYAQKYDALVSEEYQKQRERRNLWRAAA